MNKLVLIVLISCSTRIHSHLIKNHPTVLRMKCSNVMNVEEFGLLLRVVQYSARHISAQVT